MQRRFTRIWIWLVLFYENHRFSICSECTAQLFYVNSNYAPQQKPFPILVYLSGYKGTSQIQLNLKHLK